MKSRYKIIGKIDKGCDLCRTNVNNNVIKEKGKEKLYVRCNNHTLKGLMKK